MSVVAQNGEPRRRWSQRKCDSSDVYASAANSQHQVRWPSTSASVLVVLGINQEEAAERCGLHRTYYSGIERGIRNVSLMNIEKIAKGLKKSLPELFGRV
jgi:DNA-binding XRE family transcriptional regulator